MEFLKLNIFRELLLVGTHPPQHKHPRNRLSLIYPDVPISSAGGGKAFGWGRGKRREGMSEKLPVFRAVRETKGPYDFD